MLTFAPFRDGGRLGAKDSSLGAHVSSMVSIAALMRDLGYGATSSAGTVVKVLEHLSISPANASSTLSDEEISRTLAMMAMTHTGLTGLAGSESSIFKGVDPADLHRATTWDVELFMSVVLELVKHSCHKVWEASFIDAILPEAGS